MLTAIPKQEDPDVYAEICPVSSRFVELTDGDIFDVKMQYPLLGMSCAVSRCFVRKEVREKLIEAQKRLPDGYRLRIWDAWRPFSLQLELYEAYSRGIIKQFHLEHVSADEQRRIIKKYISFPENDRDLPPVHTTGGAVDVTLIDAAGNELPMGTVFDDFGEEAHTDYYETAAGEAEEICRNRRILYQCMTAAGFTNLPSEWWHFDYGDRFWAYYTNTPALYRGAFTLEEVE